MGNLTSHCLAASALALAVTGLGGCATTDYVDEQVAGLQSQITTQNGQLTALSERVGRHDAQFTKVDADIQATAKLAAGKFNYTKVGEETVLFNTASFTLAPEEKQKIVDLATRLKTENQGRYIEVEGFADSRGDSPSNRILGVRRSYAVYDLLREQGVPLNRITLISHGEQHPVAANDSSAGLAQNRRVIISVVE